MSTNEQFRAAGWCAPHRAVGKHPIPPPRSRHSVVPCSRHSASASSAWCARRQSAAPHAARKPRAAHLPRRKPRLPRCPPGRLAHCSPDRSRGTPNVVDAAQVRPQRRDPRGTRPVLAAGATRTCSRLTSRCPCSQRDSATPRMQVVGIGDYCYGGPDCDEVPAEMPVPDGANIEGSSDLTCDISGNTDGQGDCHLLVTDTDGRRALRGVSGQPGRRPAHRKGSLHLGPGQGVSRHFPRASVHQCRRRGLPDRGAYPNGRPGCRRATWTTRCGSSCPTTG